MAKCRLRFSKTGKAKYISHLDLMRTFQRAFMRSGIQIKHTDGFNPHAYISIALPLSLGAESICEILDIDVTDDIQPELIPEMLNPYLPEGIFITAGAKPIKKAKDIKYIRLRSVYSYDEGVSKALVRQLEDFFRQNEIIMLKKTKKGESEFDLTPHIKKIDAQLQDENHIVLESVVSAQNPTVNSSHLLGALEQLSLELVPSFSQDARIEIYDENMGVFG